MAISVLLEPKGTGFRASMSSPMALTADGATEDAALTAIRTAYLLRLSSGAKVVEIPIARVDDILRTARALGEDPQFEEYLKEVESHRKINNAISEAE